MLVWSKAARLKSRGMRSPSLRRKLTAPRAIMPLKQIHAVGILMPPAALSICSAA